MGRRDSAGLRLENPREHACARARARRVAPGEGERSSAAGIALAAHEPVDHTRTSLPLMGRVERGRHALEVLAAVVAGCQSPGA